MRSLPRVPVLARAACAAASAILLASCDSGTVRDVASTTTVAATGTTTPGAADELGAGAESWTKVAPPTIEGSTDAVTTTGAAPENGTYWGIIGGKPLGATATFTLQRIYFGAACEEYAARTKGVQCMSSYTVQEKPSAVVSLTADALVSVASPDHPGESWSVSVADLLGLAYGSATSPVDGYWWAPFPFVVTVENGVATRAEQFWIP